MYIVKPSICICRQTYTNVKLVELIRVFEEYSKCNLTSPADSCGEDALTATRIRWWMSLTCKMLRLLQSQMSLAAFFAYSAELLATAATFPVTSCNFRELRRARCLMLCCCRHSLVSCHRDALPFHYFNCRSRWTGWLPLVLLRIWWLSMVMLIFALSVFLFIAIICISNISFKCLSWSCLASGNVLVAG